MAEATQQSIEVPVGLSVFGSLVTEMAPQDLPEGLSPDCQDVVFLPGSVASRPALHKIYPQLANHVTITYCKTYIQPNGNPLNLILDSSGILWKEDVTNAPGVLVQIGSAAPGSYAGSVSAFGREFIVFHDGINGIDVPRQFDGTNLDRVSQGGPGAAPTVADSGAAGNISIGIHKVVVLFRTRQGYVTKASPIVQWTAAGAKKVTISNLPIGPPNVIARIICFTGAGGGSFFYLPFTTTFPTSVSATVVNDNTTTTVDLDFVDNSLFNGIAIDVSGNNLFVEQVLSPSIGVFYYASRMFYWGQRSIVTNLLNMGFEGGYLSGVLTTPLGWTVDTVGGVLVAAGVDFGMGWLITGDGTANAVGRITQPAYQDFLGINILQSNTQYSFLCWAKRSAGALNGNLIFDVFSAGSGGVLASASIPIANLSTVGAFVQPVQLNAVLPAVIPSDTVIRIYESNMAAGQTLIIDEMYVTPTNAPFKSGFTCSYVNNPEAFDGITGNLVPTDDPTPIQTCFDYHDELHFLSGRGLHNTQDLGGSEPSSWQIREITNRCGASSPRACDMGENFAGWVSSPISEPPSGRGFYLYTGGQVYKASQEIQTIFDAVNPAAQQTIWTKNDPVDRRFYIGLPVNGATAPNLILTLDYRELDTASDIVSRPPVHISFTGKMICSDLSRKWTKWNIQANCAELLKFSAGTVRLCLGAGNGQTPGLGNGNANVYYLDSAKLTDDDYGLISPYYVTYFFINHEAEMALQVGLHRKLYKRLAIFITGVGNLQITPLANSMTNAVAPTPLITMSTNPTEDVGVGINVRAMRVAFKIASLPVTGQTDNSFNTGKFIVTMMQDPVAPLLTGAI